MTTAPPAGCPAADGAPPDAGVPPSEGEPALAVGAPAVAPPLPDAVPPDIVGVPPACEVDELLESPPQPVISASDAIAVMKVE